MGLLVDLPGKMCATSITSSLVGKLDRRPRSRAPRRIGLRTFEKTWSATLSLSEAFPVSGKLNRRMLRARLRCSSEFTFSLSESMVSCWLMLVVLRASFSVLVSSSRRSSFLNFSSYSDSYSLTVLSWSRMESSCVDIAETRSSKFLVFGGMVEKHNGEAQ